MRKFLLITLTILVLILSACGTDTQKTDNVKDNVIKQKEKKLDASDYVEKLKAAGLPIGNIITYTAETDPNKLLGRPNQYTSKVNFADTRVEQFEESEPIGGTVEVFTNKEDASKRKEYIETMAKEMSMLTQYIYLNGTVLLRIDQDLTPDQATKYAKTLNNIVR